RRGAGNPRRDRPRLCARLPDPGGDGRRNGFRPMGLTCSGNGKEHHVYHGVRVPAVHGHVTYMDDRNIDVQIIGPRPFLMMGWMEEHLLPAWTRYVNDMIHQQCQMVPDRFLGAAML